MDQAKINQEDHGGAPCLTDQVCSSMQTYFKDLNGAQVKNLYEVFLATVEKPFFRAVVEYNGGNMSRTAMMLGINKKTLQNRLRKYDIKDD